MITHFKIEGKYIYTVDKRGVSKYTCRRMMISDDKVSFFCMNEDNKDLLPLTLEDVRNPEGRFFFTEGEANKHFIDTVIKSKDYKKELEEVENLIEKALKKISKMLNSEE